MFIAVPLAILKRMFSLKFKSQIFEWVNLFSVQSIKKPARNVWHICKYILSKLKCTFHGLKNIFSFCCLFHKYKSQVTCTKNHDSDALQMIILFHFFKHAKHIQLDNSENMNKVQYKQIFSFCIHILHVFCICKICLFISVFIPQFPRPKPSSGLLTTTTNQYRNQINIITLLNSL